MRMALYHRLTVNMVRYMHRFLLNLEFQYPIHVSLGLSQLGQAYYCQTCLADILHILCIQEESLQGFSEVGESQLPCSAWFHTLWQVA